SESERGVRASWSPRTHRLRAPSRPRATTPQDRELPRAPPSDGADALWPETAPGAHVASAPLQRRCHSSKVLMNKALGCLGVPGRVIAVRPAGAAVSVGGPGVRGVSLSCILQPPSQA